MADNEFTILGTLPPLFPPGARPVDKAYRASQMRWPKGHPLGGQWRGDNASPGVPGQTIETVNEPVGSLGNTKNSPAPPNPFATRMSGMPADFKASQLAKLAEVGLDYDDLVSNLDHVMARAKAEFPEVYELGQRWYQDAHERLMEHAAANGFDAVSAAGMTAAMSPRSEWGQNVAMTGEMMRQIRANEHVQLDADQVAFLRARVGEQKETGHPSTTQLAMRELLTQLDADGRGPRLSALSDDGVAIVVKLTAQRRGLLAEVPTGKGVFGRVSWNTGHPNIVKAVQIARGAHPGDVLGGHKVRSFYNNLIDPQNHAERDDVTIDTHMASAAQLFRMPMDLPRADRTFFSGASRDSNQLGSYPIYADAMREVASRHNLMPHQAQAILWVTWQQVRHDYPGATVEEDGDVREGGARQSTIGRYGVQVGRHDALGPRYVSQRSDWAQYQAGTITYDQYVERTGVA